MPRLISAGFLIAGVLCLAACGTRHASPAPDPITAAAYLTAPLWDDGQAEIAFYTVERTRGAHGRDTTLRFLAGSYLVKHDFDVAAMAKATDQDRSSTPAFKYAFFYAFESGSYEFKHHHVVNAAQADLAPLKASYTGFDWCSNVYQELAFNPDGTVVVIYRSDDYGNRAARFDYRPRAYPIAMLPLLVRGLDFEKQPEQAFSVVLPDGSHVGTTARHDGLETVDLPGGSVEAERIVVTYERPVPSLLDGETDPSETYWRGTDAARRLLKWTGGNGRYMVTLTEALRSPYWQEDFWPRLTRVSERP